MIKRLLLSVALLLPLCALPAHAAYTDAQKEEIAKIAKDYMVKHPEAVKEILESFQVYMQAEQQKAEEENAKKQSEFIRDPENKARIMGHDVLPVGGNPDGDVTMVEFFDYNCGHCRAAYATIKQVLGEDKKVRMIFREFPILGPGSNVAAKAALASVKQGKYIPFHNALMESPAQLDETSVFNIAKNVGLNVDQLKKDMDEDFVNTELKKNYILAEQMGIRGTPGFVIGDNLYPGEIPAEMMKKLFSDLRASAVKENK